MSLSWSARKAQLSNLLGSQGNEDEDALELDQLMHGQSVIGKTSKTVEIDSLRFQDGDLQALGRLARGQFGVIDVVKCRFDGRVYVRKSIEKRFAMRNRDQCFPQFERDILLRATRCDSLWAPHLICAFQTATHLKLVMDYAECGTLWDVLESSPHDGKVPQSDLRWWAPQLVSAIHWCHSQGFAHRDIKPQNFVIATNARVLLIDFGSAAPLLPPRRDGSRAIPKRYCLVPCGTCDYISPEILRAHEDALVALEMQHEAGVRDDVDDEEGYGLETDWWSMGAMLYEMAYGETPFFAKDVRQTYLRIVDHHRSLRFNNLIRISTEFRDLLCRLLTSSEQRIGRATVNDFIEHPFFKDVQWHSLRDQSPPHDLHLPQFVDCDVANDSAAEMTSGYHDSASQPFAFSALFHSSPMGSPGLSVLHTTPSHGSGHSLPKIGVPSTFIGFSWGPTPWAFSEHASVSENAVDDSHGFHAPSDMTPRPFKSVHQLRTPQVPFISAPNPFVTPMRPNALLPHHSLPRTSTSRRTAPRRSVSDREAMQQLVNCVGMSARKKVLESGRKPRVLASISRSGTVKELRFMPVKDDDVDDDPRVKHNPSRLGSLVPMMSESEDTDAEVPPSPSPSPRPGSVLSRRSGTPTTTTTSSQRFGSASLSFGQVQSSGSTTRLNEGASLERLSELEEKHSLLMQDISDIERRLGRLSTLVGRRDST